MEDPFLSSSNAARGAHLVGSLPHADADSGFEDVAKILGQHVVRIPDGETGPRKTWALWQFGVVSSDPNMEADPNEEPRPYPAWVDGKPGVVQLHPFRFKASADLDSIHLNTTYAEHALASYARFAELKKQGKIPAATRFMVALATPLAIGAPHVSPSALPDFLKVYERSLIADLGKIVAGIPADQLSIQWDIAVEVIMLEGAFGLSVPKEEFEEATLAQMERLFAAVPEAVEMGFHLCYGDPDGKHVVEPKDMGLMVGLANKIITRSPRSVAFVHMPVPIDRDDDAYFAPLTDLKQPADCKLYLGLVHLEDGEAGTQSRIATASKFARDFGVATECGMGREPLDQAAQLLSIHANCALPS